MTPSATEISLIDDWQRDFPLIERPFAEVGRGVGLDEAGTIATFRRLSDAGIIARIGAVVRPHSIGASTLAAVRVPPDRLEAVAATISAEPLVNHNYERTHAINLWFVIAGPQQQAIADTIGRIERSTGLAVLVLPLLQAYHIDLGFGLAGRRQESRGAPRSVATYCPDALDRAVLAAIEDGLPLVDRPYRDVAQRLGLSEEELLDRLRHMATSGALARFGCVVRHRALGYTANAMAVWNIPDEIVDTVAGQFAKHPSVTLCYRRPRRLPDWPYNLFCMVHAKCRRDAYAAIDDLNLVGETGLNQQAVLFSTRCFKQRGAVFSERRGGLH
jgi:DNA-binding Lrp family transcriptional regulator